MARIEAPFLTHLYLMFFYQPVFDIPQVPQFTRCIEKFVPPFKTAVYFFVDAVRVFIFLSHDNFFILQPQCKGLDRQLSSLEQIFTQCSSIFSHVVGLRLEGNGDPQGNQSKSWLRCLRPFNAVKTLCVGDDYEELQLHIARVLGELGGEGAAEVFPMLHTLIFNQCYSIRTELIPLLKPFIDARQQSGHPVVVE